MLETGTCPKCGAAEIIPSRMGAVTARTDAHPDALIFKEAERCELYGHVCAKCGFTELYVRNPQKLYQAHQKAEADRKKLAG